MFNKFVILRVLKFLNVLFNHLKIAIKGNTLVATPWSSKLRKILRTQYLNSTEFISSLTLLINL